MLVELVKNLALNLVRHWKFYRCAICDGPSFTFHIHTRRVIKTAEGVKPVCRPCDREILAKTG